MKLRYIFGGVAVFGVAFFLGRRSGRKLLTEGGEKA